MAGDIVRPYALPNRASPVASEKVPVDNGSTVGGATIEALVNAGRPLASQAEAEAGVQATKSMTPLTTKQAIDAFAVTSLTAGANTTVDLSDPNNPVISYDGSAVTDGDKGDVIVSAAGTTWEVKAGLNASKISYLAAADDAVARTLTNKLGEMPSVKDWGAKGDDRTNDTAAFVAGIQHAIATAGILFVPPGEYLLDEIDIGDGADIRGGVLLFGTNSNSIGTRSAIKQRDINTPVFTVKSACTTISGLSFTSWAGAKYDENGDPITCVSVTSNTMTLSADPWIGEDAVIWELETPFLSGDGTSFPSVIQVALWGSYYASSVTKNIDGTVTLTGVKGANGTSNSDLANTVGHDLENLISLAHAVKRSTISSSSCIIRLDMRENSFYNNLWFNQVTRAFHLDPYGSGSGLNTGDGNIGFMHNIVLDQAINFIHADLNMHSLQCVNVQIFGVDTAFAAPFGNITLMQLVGLQLFIGKLFQASGNIEAIVMPGASLNAGELHGYCDNLIVIGGAIKNCNFAGTNIGRSRSVCIQAGSIDATSFAGVNVLSNGEGTSDPWMYITGAGGITNSHMSGINFAAKHSSNSNRLAFVNASPSVVGTVFGGEFIGYQSGTPVAGWKPLTLLNGFSNLSGGTPLRYFKDQNGIGHVYGALTGGSSGTIAFQLPAECRPPAADFVVAGLYYNGSTRLPAPAEIDTSGNVYIYATLGSWCGINFRFPTRQ